MTDNSETNSFAQIVVDSAKASKFIRATIDRDAYERWKHGLLFEIIRGKHIGKSFCEEFDIRDFVLLYVLKNEREDVIFSYIEDMHYVKA